MSAGVPKIKYYVVHVILLHNSINKKSLKGERNTSIMKTLQLWKYFSENKSYLQSAWDYSVKSHRVVKVVEFKKAIFFSGERSNVFNGQFQEQHWWSHPHDPTQSPGQWIWSNDSRYHQIRKRLFLGSDGRHAKKRGVGIDPISPNCDPCKQMFVCCSSHLLPPSCIGFWIIDKNSCNETPVCPSTK